VPQFESLIGLLLAAVALAAAARRLGVPSPAFLAIGGAILAFVPGMPTFALDPDLALALFVAPVLLDAAYDTSPRDLRDNWLPVSGLAIVAVLVTIAAVAWITRLLVPQLPWAAAITLGAVIAPPDAAAATAVLRQVQPPHRILTILEGESLLNDATALLIYRLAVAAAITHAFSIGQVAPTFLLAVAGSLIVGPLLAQLTLWALLRITDPPSAIIMQFITTFGVWILADRLGLSAVLTMVAYAITVARRAPERQPARLRIPSYAVWDTVVFIMNVLAFILIGLQVRPILEGLEREARTQYFLVAVAVLITVIVVRFVWVMTYNYFYRLYVRRYGFHPRRPMLPPTVKGALLVAWSGMRGIVTLAAALALPVGAEGVQFPYRNLIVLTAFCVVLGTLVLQGLTLKPLVRALDLHDDDPVGREVTLARERAVNAALSTLDGDDSPAAKAVRLNYKTLLQRAGRRPDEGECGSNVHDDLRRRAMQAARQSAAEMRRSDEIGDDAFHRLEEELDWVEMSDAIR
jgi:CPA1 family monovalent cation:H+ antiporter